MRLSFTAKIISSIAGIMLECRKRSVNSRAEDLGKDTMARQNRPRTSLKKPRTSTKKPQTSLKILHEDDELILVYKPPGKLTQGDATGDKSMVDSVRQYLAKTSGQRFGKVFAGMVHRLDRPATGVLVFAKTPEVAAYMMDQFKKRAIRKYYLAVVHGQPSPKGAYEDYLAKEPQNRRSVVTSEEEGKAAQLRFLTLDVRNDRSLVLIRLETGRSHQIRVQFSSRGFPIVGDRKYGSREVLRNPGMIALCAYQLIFKRPGGRRLISVRSPRPQHWPWFDPNLFHQDCKELNL